MNVPFFAPLPAANQNALEVRLENLKLQMQAGEIAATKEIISWAKQNCMKAFEVLVGGSLVHQLDQRFVYYARKNPELTDVEASRFVVLSERYDFVATHSIEGLIEILTQGCISASCLAQKSLQVILDKGDEQVIERLKETARNVVLSDKLPEEGKMRLHPLL